MISVFKPLIIRIWPLWLLLGANILILAPTPPGPRYAAALALLAFLPGWVWLQAFFDSSRPDPGDKDETTPWSALFERLTLAIGLSLALTVIGAMLTVYLPGPLDLNRLLLVINAFIIIGLALTWRQRGSTCQGQATRFRPAASWPLRLLASSVIILVGLLILAAALRLPRLGYAEFHEDEAEALMLGVRLMQGEDYALFLHRKGPAQMLVPVSFWLLTGQINESLARFPFALSSLCSVATLFFIGRRWFGWQAGVMAALLWAVNGYAIAFGRMVQYQSLIFFLGPLGLYCLYLAGVEYWHMGRWQILGAILLAVCLLAHFDALMLLPVAAYLGWVSIFKGIGKKETESSPRRHSRLITAALALTLFLTLLASFYIPYLLDPEFQHTASYLAESRVKPGLLYNNLNLLRQLDQAYSSQFYLPLLALGMVIFAIAPVIRRHNWGEGFSTVEARAAWLMFGAGFVGYVFLVDDPRTHLYIMYPGAVLLTGAGLYDLRFTTCARKGIYDLRLASHRWSPLVGSLRLTLPRLLASLAAIIIIGLIGVYEVTIFLSTESTLDRLRKQWNGSAWQRVYNDLPKAREYFGYPKREGWKTIGAMRAQGLFSGDFRSVNEDFVIPIWYNFGQARSCYDTPAHFFVRVSGELAGVKPATEKYRETGQVTREEDLRLRIFSAQPLPGRTESAGKVSDPPPVYPLEAFEEVFDQLATTQRFIRQVEPSQPLGVQFGPTIELVGFDLPQTTVAPGETLTINLYWRAQQSPIKTYRAFVHLTDGTNLWAQQDDDPACRLPTSIWRAGQRGLGQFRLTIKPDTPPGRYPLIVGLYQADTLERLKITGGTAGKVGDDFLWLGDVEVINQLAVTKEDDWTNVVVTVQ